MIKISRTKEDEWVIRAMSQKAVVWVADYMAVMQRVSGMNFIGQPRPEVSSLPLAGKELTMPAAPIRRSNSIYISVHPLEDQSKSSS